MKTFNEWLLEVAEYKPGFEPSEEKETMLDTLTRIVSHLNKEQKVRFALYCANDCKDLIRNENARECIRMVERWLLNKREIDRETMENLDMEIHNDFNYADSAAQYAAMSVGNDTFPPFAATDAAAAIAKITSFDSEVDGVYPKRDEKMQEYINYALALGGFVDKTWNNMQQHHSFVKTLDFDKEMDVMVFLDYLSDYYPDGNYDSANSTFKVGGFSISGKNQTDLARKITNNQIAKTMLTKLYKEIV